MVSSRMLMVQHKAAMQHRLPTRKRRPRPRKRQLLQKVKLKISECPLKKMKALILHQRTMNLKAVAAVTSRWMRLSTSQRLAEGDLAKTRTL